MGAPQRNRLKRQAGRRGMAKQSFDDDTVVRRSDTQLSSEMDGETIIMHTGSGSYFTLDPVGTAIWSRIENSVAVGALCKTLMDEYDVDEDTCRRDVVAFLDNLAEQDLLIVDAA